jgi:hypothetical protein
VKKTMLSILLAILLLQTKGLFALETQGNWLFIGDSHSVRGFGDGMRESLFRSGLVSESRFHQYSISGTMATHWMDGSLTRLAVNWARKIPGKEKEVIGGRVTSEVHSFPMMNRELKPTHIIVALGTNDSSFFSGEMRKLDSRGKDLVGRQERLLQEILAPMQSLLNENSSARCALVLPPKLKVRSVPEHLHQKFTDALKKIGEARGCLIVDSRLIRNSAPSVVSQWSDCLISGEADKAESSIYPDQTDGVHFLKTKGEYWGRCVGLLIQVSWK